MIGYTIIVITIIMDTIDKFINSYLSFPLNFNQFEDCLSEDCTGVSLKADRDLFVSDKEGYIRRLVKKHFNRCSAANITQKNIKALDKTGTFSVYVESVQTALLPCNKIGTFTVKDNQLYKIDMDGKICYIMHNYDSELYGNPSSTN